MWFCTTCTQKPPTKRHMFELVLAGGDMRDLHPQRECVQVVHSITTKHMYCCAAGDGHSSESAPLPSHITHCRPTPPTRSKNIRLFFIRSQRVRIMRASELHAQRRRVLGWRRNGWALSGQRSALRIGRYALGCPGVRFCVRSAWQLLLFGFGL